MSPSACLKRRGEPHVSIKESLVIVKEVSLKFLISFEGGEVLKILGLQGNCQHCLVNLLTSTLTRHSVNSQRESVDRPNNKTGTHGIPVSRNFGS
ncbi:hypothetical protein Mapa_014001 [Marchantia paleacea]|nr:hypothetical protein Mapa_014001 [Marchantia paleacea]